MYFQMLRYFHIPCCDPLTHHGVQHLVMILFFPNPIPTPKHSRLVIIALVDGCGLSDGLSNVSSDGTPLVTTDGPQLGPPDGLSDGLSDGKPDGIPDGT